MSENIRLTLVPSTLLMEAGGEASTMVLTVQNTSQVVDQFAIQVDGLDPSWITVPTTGVALFPQDRDEVRLNIKPPQRTEAKAGDYPFTIRVSSGAVPGDSTSISGIVKLQPLAAFKVEMSPQRARCRRQARFRLTLSNAGNMDLSLKLSATDREQGCKFVFSEDEPLVAANCKRDISLTVRPRRSWLIGKSKSYDFTVNVTPQGGRGEPKATNGYLAQKPLLESWRPVWSIVKTIIVLTLLILGISFALYLGGGVQGWGNSLGGLVERGKTIAQPIFGGKLPGAQQTTLDLGFKEASDSAPSLIGKPNGEVQYDKAGNGYQNTDKGTLFWFKATNTVYFFEPKGVYVFRSGKLTGIDKP